MSKSSYRIAVNVEWTSKCNARCAMCPRTMISDPKLMSLSTWEQVLSRLSCQDAFRVIIAGYGEPTTHPKFDDFVDAMHGRHLQFDMATNGSMLDKERLERMDGLFAKLMISFSSTDPDVYQSVHTNLDQREVMENILLAHRTLKKTKLIINLSPTPECLMTLDGTIRWLHENGIRDLHMSPTYYDRRRHEYSGHAIRSGSEGEDQVLPPDQSGDGLHCRRWRFCRTVALQSLQMHSAQHKHADQCARVLHLLLQ